MLALTSPVPTLKSSSRHGWAALNGSGRGLAAGADAEPDFGYAFDGAECNDGDFEGGTVIEGDFDGGVFTALGVLEGGAPLVFEPAPLIGASHSSLSSIVTPVVSSPSHSAVVAVGSVRNDPGGGTG